MSIHSKLILQVWGGGFGLASVNSDCLSVMAYCKSISHRADDIEFKVCNDPYAVGFRNLPLLTIVDEVKDKDSGESRVVDQRTIAGVTNILDEIRKFGSNDCKLNTKQSADVLAYTSMIHRNLVPALNYLWWVDNYSNLTKQWYTKHLPFFLKAFWPRRQQSHHMVALSMDSSNAKSFNTLKIFENAANCLKILSQKLGNKKYFFNDSPSTLDIIVFGHLSMLEHVTFVNCELMKQYATYQNLVDHCAHLEPHLQSYVVKAPQAKLQLDLSNDDGFSKKRNILFALFSISAMVAYAFATGLVQFDLTDDDDEDLYDDTPDFNEFDEIPEDNEE